MRCNGYLVLSALLALTIPATPSFGATFGNVVAIGGHSADAALDESRGVLYIANFTANRIDVMSLADNAIHTSINVAAQPGSIALSRDNSYLLVAHFGQTTPVAPSRNLLTLIHLTDNSQQTFITGDPPLGVAFFNTVPVTGAGNYSGPGQALVVTTNGFYTLDPRTGLMQVVSTLTNLATSIPVPPATFPGQILQTALSTSGDGTVIWGIGGAGTGTQVIYQYYAKYNTMAAFTDVSSPPLLARVSVNNDGSAAMVGWVMLTAGGVAQSKYPNVVTSTNVTGHVFDNKNGLIYGQIPDNSQPLGPPYTSGTSAGSSTVLPTLLIMESDNLTVRDRLYMPENITGRVILNSAGTTIYALSDSGVMVLPVGSLNSEHRLSADHEDLLVQTNFCNRATLTQSLTITDPGGGRTDFTISASQPGVTISPAGGMTPATVQVTIDPGKFQTLGTSVVTLKLASDSSVNVPPSVRLLVSNPDQNQRGTVVNVPGVLTDLLPDPARNRFYVLRQDVNQLLIYDASTNQRLVALRTATTPTMMAMTADGKYLMVGHDNSQFVTVYDLATMQAVNPITLPGGHYGRSVAASNQAILVLARDEGTGKGIIDQVDFVHRRAAPLGTLGIYNNEVPSTGVLTSSPNGRTILMAAPDGTVMLYSADSDTFVAARKDLPSLQGAFAASSYDTYVVGNSMFNASLVPTGTLDATSGVTAGFSFTGQGGYRVTALTASTAGVIQNLPALTTAKMSPTAMVEAPILPTTTTAFTRTLAPMPSSGTVIVLTTSGFTVLSANYAAATTPPAIASVNNSANGSASVAAGGLISVYGSQMAATNIATSQIPLPTALGESCLVVNGAPIPLLFVSAQQVNAQLPFSVSGNVTMSIHTPAGISNNYNFTVKSAAPAIFMSGTAGPETGLATIFRADNGQLVTPTNPIHYNDTVVIYLTGMGLTSPSVDAGMETPPTLLTAAVQTPIVTLGNSQLNVFYAGLVPGYVSGLYQINATVPGGVTQGTDIPLVISQGGSSTTLSVRVVK